MAGSEARCDILVMGAGVIGLSIARALARRGTTILVEARPTFGQETSSRNSEVIHSGIYYPVGSRKTLWCIEGRRLLVDYLQAKGIPHRLCGKWVLATSPQELDRLEALAHHAEHLDVPLKRVTAVAVRETEPSLRCLAGLFLPGTGILDSHSFLRSLELDCRTAGALIAYQHKVVGVRRNLSDWSVDISTPQGSLKFHAGIVINALGLRAAEWSQKALVTSRYEHRFCRGRYFHLPNSPSLKSLVYPLPEQHGLGIHATLDLVGMLRFGPDVEWVQPASTDQLDLFYDCDWDRERPRFASAVRKYLPSLREEDLKPGLIGIRPKLFVDGSSEGDFLIENHQGYIHCLGVESPGLTAALAMAQSVSRMI